MTDEELSALMKQAGIREERNMTNPPRPTGMVMCTSESLKKFAALVQTAERERCAKIADGYLLTAQSIVTEEDERQDWCAAVIAHQIRS